MTDKTGTHARWNLDSGQWGGGVEMLESAWSLYKDKRWTIYVYNAPPWQQEVVAARILQHSSWAQGWPSCSARLGYR